jgi:diaminopimelate decarboxylase
VGSSVLTDVFSRTGGVLHAEGVALDDLAARVGTPAFVYSANHVRGRYEALHAALEGIPHRIHYSLKANACGGILAVLRELGSGADVVSGGELFRALRAGFAPGDIIFGGVGKTEDELREGIAAGVKLINVESLAEIELANDIAASLGSTADLGFRVNPEVAVESAHKYTKTGEKGHKFGIPYDDVEHAANLARGLRNVRIRGIGMHVGSQLRSLDAHRAGAERLLSLIDPVQRITGNSLAALDLGGGLPVRYDDESEADVAGFASIVRDAGLRSKLEILVEPGRFMVANSGVLLTRVLYRKRTGGTEYVVVDAGMTELLRPSHYDAYHRIEAVSRDDSSSGIVADVVGPVCESGDFFARARSVPDIPPGEFLAIHSVGAYGFVMASHYNARRRAVEVMVDGSRWAIASHRETYEDLVRQEPHSLEWRDGT